MIITGQDIQVVRAQYYTYEDEKSFKVATVILFIFK